MYARSPSNGAFHSGARSALGVFLGALLALVTSCASRPAAIVESGALASSDSGVAIIGSPSGYEADVEQGVAELVTEFAESGRRSFIDDATYEIELFLQARGFAVARATYEIVGDGRARIVIVPGEQSTIGRILVDRNDDCPLDADALRLYVNGPRKGLFGTGAMLYVPERVARAPELVHEDLVALGHLDATARIEDPGPREGGGPVDIRLIVDSGPSYVLGSVVFRLERTAESIGEELGTAIQAAIARTTGRREKDAGVRYAPSLEGTLRSAIADTLGSGGYPDAAVIVESVVDRETKAVDIEITADPGPFVVLADVRFEENGRTANRFLGSRLRLGRGDRYDARKVRDSVRALYRTGLFSQVTPRLVGEGDARDLVIELVEQTSIEISAEPGWGSYELGRVTVGARDRNLLGSGIAASTSATVAVRAVRANVSFTNPWFLRRELIGDLKLEFDRRQEPSFTRESRGLGAFVTKEWTRTSATSLGYRFRRSEAKDIAAVDEDVLETQSAFNVSGFVVTQRYDVRDALFAPTDGFYAEVSVEAAAKSLGSELEFFRTKLSTAWFAPLSADDVIGIGVRAGVIAPAFDETTIPIQERFFAGGENSVRSFSESALGPRDAAGEPLGGEAFGTASVEWRHELGRAFQSAVFFDAGFVESDASNAFAFNDVRTGVGVGIRYLLPIGPLRIDAAVNPDRRAGEDEWVIQFAIGMPF